MRWMICSLLGVFLLVSNAYAVTQHGNACAVLAKHPSWYAITKQTEAKWGVPVQVQLAIMRTESDFHSNAKNPVSSAYGYAQVINQTWRNYQKDNHPNAQRTDFRAASDFIGWYANRMHNIIGISKSDPYALYVAYHDGGGGYKKAVKHPNSLASRLARRVSRDAHTYKTQLSSCIAGNDVTTPANGNALPEVTWKKIMWMHVSI